MRKSVAAKIVLLREFGCCCCGRLHLFVAEIIEKSIRKKALFACCCCFLEHFLLLGVWRGSDEVVVRRSLGGEKVCFCLREGKVL